eukprot:NODE_625_length_2006_cov_68.475785_g581_i0.p1 GENE.NODE_625_length_2006_cov_68.475785_g581_i0~~NODE_625_length_2006_cov_68.475785_g581_i0.p1  ORF type:complete len:614 (-),score=118.00 NODE_625_length_2006_cov_68.475785_g581_i0:163-1815(-)
MRPVLDIRNHPQKYGNTFHCSDPYYDSGIRSAQMACFILVYRNSEYVGSVCVIIQLHVLSSYLSQMAATTESKRIILFDIFSHLIAASHGAVDDEDVPSFIFHRQSKDTLIAALPITNHSWEAQFEFEGVVYLVQHKEITKYATTWTVFQTFPKDLIWGSVTTGNLLSILASACVFAVAFVLSLVMTFLITRPIERLEAGLRSTGKLQLDTDLEQSRFKELAMLQQTFAQMIEQLIEYKSFLPSAMVTPQVEVDPRSASVSMSSLSSNAPSSKSNLLALQATSIALNRRPVTILVVRCANFPALLASTTENELTEIMSQTYEAVSRCLKTQGGSLESVADGQLFIQFGAVVRQHTHCQRACESALMLLEELPKKNNSVDVEWSIGISSGIMTVGNVGIAAIRHFVTFGHPSVGAKILAELGEVMKAPILIDKNVSRNAGVHFKTRMFDRVRTPNYGEFEVFELMANNVKSDEWMYELRELEKTEPCNWDTALTLFFKRQYEQALPLLGASEGLQAQRLRRICEKRLTEEGQLTEEGEETRIYGFFPESEE